MPQAANAKKPEDMNEAQLIARLRSIEAELKECAYLFHPDDLILARIAIATLLELLTTIDKVARVNSLYFIRVSIDGQKTDVPVHLEEYVADPVLKRKQLLDALPRLFISSYETVKEAGPDYLRIFISKLYGNCIDARTRSAFDYAAAVHSPPCFQDVMQKGINKFAEQKADPSYYTLFAEILNKHWNVPYSKDKANTSLCQSNGVFNASCFPLLMEYFESNLLLEYGEDSDYEKHIQAKSIPKRDLSVFLHFVLFSAVKHEDHATIKSAFKALTEVLAKQGVGYHLDIISPLLSLVKEASQLLAKGEEEKGLDHQSELMTIILTGVNKALNRWFPPFWTKLEISNLAQILSKKSFIDHIRTNKNNQTAEIRESRYLSSLVKQTFAQETFSVGVDLAYSLHVLGCRKHYETVFKIIKKNNAIQPSDLIKLCRLFSMVEGDEYESFFKGSLRTLATQNTDLESAAEAFKLFLSMMEDGSFDDLPVEQLLMRVHSSVGDFLPKMIEFNIVLSQSNISVANKRLIEDLIRDAMSDSILAAASTWMGMGDKRAANQFVEKLLKSKHRKVMIERILNSVYMLESDPKLDQANKPIQALVHLFTRINQKSISDPELSAELSELVYHLYLEKGEDILWSLQLPQSFCRLASSHGSEKSRYFELNKSPNVDITNLLAYTSQHHETYFWGDRLYSKNEFIRYWLNHLYENNQVYSQLNNLKEQIQLMPITGSAEDLCTEFSNLYRKIEHELLSHQRTDIQNTPYPAILQHFTVLATEMNRGKKHTLAEITASFAELEDSLVGKPPMSPALQVLIFGLIAAMIVISLAYPFYLLAAANGSLNMAVSMGVLMGTATQELVVDGVIGFFGGMIFGYCKAENERIAHCNMQDDLAAVTQEVNSFHSVLAN